MKFIRIRSSKALLAAWAAMHWAMASLTGQIAAHRQVSFVSLQYTAASGTAGWLQCIPTGTSPLAMEWSRPGVAPTVNSPAPFEQVMGGQWLGGQQFLLCGVSGYPSTTQSRLSCFSLVDQPPSIVESSFLSVAGVDIRAACWHATLGMLFVVDGVSGNLLGAPWSPASPIPSWSAFLPMFGNADVPLLQSDATIGIRPTSMGLIVHDVDFGVGRQATLLGATWAFADWSKRTSVGPRWALDEAMEAPTQSNLNIRLEGGGGSSAQPYQIAALDDGMIVAQGVHPGAGVHQQLPPPVFHALPGRTFVLGGGSRRPEYLTPIVGYGAPQGSSIVSVTADLSFRPELCVVDTEKRFGLAMQLKRGASGAMQTFTGYTLVGIRSGANDPITQSGGHTIINGLVLEAFPVVFPSGVGELYLRRPIPIPNDDGFANLVVFFQVVIDDGSGAWITSSIKGTAIRPRPTAAAGLSTQGTSGMSLTEYLHHCEQLVHVADRTKARTWVMERNPQAMQMMTDLRQRMSN